MKNIVANKMYMCMCRMLFSQAVNVAEGMACLPYTR